MPEKAIFYLMKPTNKKHFKYGLAICLAFLSLTASVTSAIAWFSGDGSSIEFGNGEDVNVVAGLQADYYGGGTGTETDPFIIKNKNHLYNLAWLQYLGKYNTSNYTADSPTKLIQEKYFKIVDDIDMSGIVLPPIGTETYPFFGHIDGGIYNGNTLTGCYTISNLVVSNDNPKNAVSDFGVKKPRTIFDHALTLNGETQPTRVIGFFGVVGYIPTNGALVTNDYSSITPSLKNITLSNITIENRTQEMLIGMAAGYVDGTMSGIKVTGSSALNISDIAGDTKAIDSTRITSKLSDYGLVGYSKQTGAAGGFSQALSEYYDSGDPAHGGETWGGSVPIRAYNMFIYRKFLTYNNSLEKSNFQTKSSNINSKTNTTHDYDIEMYYSCYTSGNVNTTNNGSTYTTYMSPDYFGRNPANNNSVINGSKTAFIYSLSDGTYLPLKFNESNEKQWDTTKSTNTGYIVGRNGYINMSATHERKIGNSLFGSSYDIDPSNSGYNGDTQNSGPDPLYTSSTKLAIITHDSSHGWCLIDDGKTSFTPKLTALNLTPYSASSLNLNAYTDARKTFGSNLASGLRLSGLQFLKSTPDGTLPNMLSLTQGLKIMGKTNTDYSSYDLPKGYIDFNVKSSGTVSLFAGSYMAMTYSSHTTFFSLYKVERNNSGTITAMKRITNIYNSPNPTTNEPYVYKFASDTNAPTNSGEVMDMPSSLEANLTTNNSTGTYTNMLFYFEIPVNGGEYAIGMVPKYSNLTGTNAVAGANLLYLDIGTNGESSDAHTISAYSVTTSAQSNKYPLGVDFDVIGAGNAGGDSFCIVINASASGRSIFTVSNDKKKVTISSPTGYPTIPANYSYRSERYTANDPPTGTNKFTVVGATGYTYINNNPTRREMHISVYDSSNNAHLIHITDIIVNGEIDSVSYYYNGAETTLDIIQDASHTPSLTSAVIDAIRQQPAAIILTKTSEGAAIFNCELPDNPLDWTNKDLYKVTIRPYPSGLTMDILNEDASKYTLNLNGSVVSFANNPTSYPAS